MAGQVYFGNNTYQTWIDAPQSGMKASSAGYVNSQVALNGRAFVKRSKASHREFSASWVGSLNSASNNLQVIKDFADGVYGDGPFFWLDPYATETNLMPPHWAAPGLAVGDWPILETSYYPTYPTFQTAGYSNGYNLPYATYQLPSSYAGGNIKMTIIIPDGYQLNFGWHSTSAGLTAATGPGVRILPYLRSGAYSTVQNPVSFLAGGTTRVGTSTTAGSMSQFDGATYGKVDIYLANGSASVASVAIVAMIAQITLAGTTPTSGGFIPGRGTKSLEFSSFPEIEYYSSKINSGQIGMSVNFIEVDK